MTFKVICLWTQVSWIYVGLGTLCTGRTCGHPKKRHTWIIFFLSCTFITIDHWWAIVQSTLTIKLLIDQQNRVKFGTHWMMHSLCLFHQTADWWAKHGLLWVPSNVQHTLVIFSNCLLISKSWFSLGPIEATCIKDQMLVDSSFLNLCRAGDTLHPKDLWTAK